MNKLKDINDEDQVADEVIEDNSVDNDLEKDHIRKNIKSFYKNIISSESLGVSIVNVNKSRPDQESSKRRSEDSQTQRSRGWRGSFRNG